MVDYIGHAMKMKKYTQIVKNLKNHNIMNKRLETAFNKYIEEQNKPKTTTYSGYNGYGCYNGYNGGYGANYNSHSPYQQSDCTIFFYEWSNIRGGAKHFKTKNDFFKFLDDNNITYTPKQRQDIQEIKYKNVFATCVPNKPELMMADTWYQLNQALTAITTTSTPSMTNQFLDI